MKHGRRVPSKKAILFQVLDQLPRVAPPNVPDEKDWKGAPSFPKDDFFTEWFRNHGRTYFFLFHKNHRVTNIQVAELIALVRTYCKGNTNDLQFLSVGGFKEAVARLVDSFEQKGRNYRPRYRFIASQYYEAIRNTAAFDVMYGSCLLYLPPNIEIDLEAISSRSGYVHSCGRSVYVRNIYKATKGEMIEKVLDYLGQSKNRCLLRPYSHEDFAYHDRNQAEDLKSGLQDVKFYADKYYIESERLAAVIEDLRVKFKRNLVIPLPGDCTADKDLISDEIEKKKFDPTHSLFLIMDHSLDGAQRDKGNRHFLICYDQVCLNASPFQLFDENKPAWVDHTTMPQTLAGAMINITRPYWPARGKVKICDFFVGSGTTWLEAMKHDDVVCFGSDIEPISRLLLEDNLRFFSDSPEQIDKYSKALEDIFERERDEAPPMTTRQWDKTAAGRAFNLAKKRIAMLEQRKNRFPLFSREFVRALRKDAPLVRLLFYTMLKCRRRYEAALEAGSMSMEGKNGAIVRQFVEFRLLLVRLASLMRSAANGVDETPHRVKFQGTYSMALTLKAKYLRALSAKARSAIKIADCTKKKSRPLFDVIVTDPPYGFNTNENKKKLAKVYASALRVMIGSLKDEGQLVIALPDWSHTGRQLPAFALKDFVAHQVLVISETLGREVIHSANQIPSSTAKAPYYWESERALRRAILHFRFRALPKYRRYIPQN
jgi:hypothetical protein